MKTKIRVLINLVIIGVLVILFQGCSIIGLTIGAVSDSKKPNYKTIQSPDTTISVEENSQMITATVKPGEKITVVTRDKQTIPGKFKGTTGENDDLALQLNCSDGAKTIPVKNVSEIQVKNWKYGALTGFLIGAAIDGVVTVVMIKAFEDSMQMNLSFE